MNDEEFAGKIVQRLDQSAAELPLETKNALAAIRRQALEAKPAWRFARREWMFATSATAVIALCASYVLLRKDEFSTLSAHEVETRVLVDDLPPQAFTDDGFETWRKQKGKP